MIVSDTKQVEVINIDNNVIKLVHVDYYNRNRDKLIPTDEYYMKMPDNSVGVNKERVEETLKYREELEKSVKEVTEEGVEKVQPKKTTKAKRK